MRVGIVLGAIQGITEWLPVSSEGFLVLAQMRLGEADLGLKMMVHQALFLHLGTFLAVLVYFRRDVFFLVKALFSFRSSPIETQKVLKFLIISTIISGITGFFLLKGAVQLEKQLEMTTKLITLGIGFLLLGTGGLQIGAKRVGLKTSQDLGITDSLLLGLAQGLAVLPGLSRSGLTVSLLLLRRFNKTQALNLSFLMSLPVVFAGNLLLNLQDFSLRLGYFWGLVASFSLGILTIDFLLRLAERINFGCFVFLFGLLTIASILV